MSLLTQLKTVLHTTLKSRLPSLLDSTLGEVDKVLLSDVEILELSHRIHSRVARNKNSFDTASQQAGDSRSVHRGYGCDYEESRLYQAGDDSRYMNWPLSARTGQLYMKVYREERRPGVFVLLDRRSSMRFGTRTRLKVTQVARAAICIAQHAQMNHASISGVILDSDDVSPRWVIAASGSQASYELMQAACQACPPENHRNISKQSSVFDFAHVLDTLCASLTQGSSVYLISDFVDLTEQHRPKLMQLALQHQVQAIHIFDPAEQQLSDVGSAQFQSSVDAKEIRIDTRNATIKSTFDRESRRYFSDRKDLFTSLKISYTPVSTTHESIENIIE